MVPAQETPISLDEFTTYPPNDPKTQGLINELQKIIDINTDNISPLALPKVDTAWTIYDFIESIEFDQSPSNETVQQRKEIFQAYKQYNPKWAQIKMPLKENGPLIDFQLEEVIGNGSEGIVFKATHKCDLFAIKIGNSSLQYEIEARKILNHHIARMISTTAYPFCDFQRKNIKTIGRPEKYVVAMEYIPGITIHNFLKKTEKLSLELANEITNVVLDVMLTYRFYNFDINNIMLSTKPPIVRFIDFRTTPTPFEYFAPNTFNQLKDIACTMQDISTKVENVSSWHANIRLLLEKKWNKRIGETVNNDDFFNKTAQTILTKDLIISKIDKIISYLTAKKIFMQTKPNTQKAHAEDILNLRNTIIAQYDEMMKNQKKEETTTAAKDLKDFIKIARNSSSKAEVKATFENSKGQEWIKFKVEQEISSTETEIEILEYTGIDCGGTIFKVLFNTNEQSMLVYENEEHEIARARNKVYKFGDYYLVFIPLIEEIEGVKLKQILDMKNFIMPLKLAQAIVVDIFNACSQKKPFIRTNNCDDQIIILKKGARIAAFEEGAKWYYTNYNYDFQKNTALYFIRFISSLSTKLKKEEKLMHWAKKLIEEFLNQTGEDEPSWISKIVARAILFEIKSNLNFQVN